MTSRNVKSTWELAGRLSGSFTDSTKKAQSQLSQLRREYSANQGELRRMQGVMRNAARGTDAYANAARRVPQLQEELNKQAFAIGDVQRQATNAARSQGQMANASGRAGSALRALSGFGLAAGAGIGVAAGAVALLTKNLNASGQEAQRLQTLSIRGIDPTAYQQASNQLQILTGDAATAQRAVGSVADAGQRAREALAYDPRSLNVRAFAGLGFDSAREFEQATRNVAGFIEHMRGELRGATQAQQDYLRAASRRAGIDPALIDSILEENRLLTQQAELKAKAAAGDLVAAKELEQITARIGRIQTDQGIITPAQIAALERYDETVQHLGLAMKDLKIGVTSSFADDLTAAATKLTEWVIQASDLWDKINPRRADTRSQAERAPTARDWADLVLTGGSGLISGRDDETRLGDFTAQIGRALERSNKAQQNLDLDGKTRRALGAALGFDLPLPGFAQGGVVPGPTGKAQLAMVHGGERVVPASERSAYDQAAMNGHQDRRSVDQSVMNMDRSVTNLNEDRRSFAETINRVFAPATHTDRSTQQYDQRRQSTDRSDRRSVGPINNYITIEGTGEPLAQAALDTINGALATGVSW